MNKNALVKYGILFTLLLVTVFIFSMGNDFRNNAYAQDIPTDTPAPDQIVPGNGNIEVINPYFSVKYTALPDGTPVSGYIINGPPIPPAEYDAERAASMMPIINATTLPDFPSFSWVFGCSAVSGAMIATYYDRGAYPNMYTGPTNGGVMPTTDTSWPTWSDGYEIDPYPNNPLIASHQGVDGRGLTNRGSIDDYWVRYESITNDPYISGGWPQHTWGTAIGDYMKTSQSAYGNVDGSTTFYTYTSSNAKLTCSAMVGSGIDDEDGTYGRKLFYEARGYTVTDCYNQKTENKISGGFSLANFQAEINAGHPVLLNLEGHSVVGYGYEGSTIYIRDTWDNNPTHTYTMPWGGSYSGMDLYSVSIVHLTSTPSTKRVLLPIVLNKSSYVGPILNGDFEQGRVSWQEFSTHGWPLIVQTFPGSVTPYDGTWAVWLGGDDNETAYIQQQVVVPTDYRYLSYWHWIASEDSCGNDIGKVLVNGTVVEQYDLCSANNTGGWVKRVVNLSAYAGTEVTIQIRSESDESLNSNLFIDHVAFQSSLTSTDPMTASTIDFDASSLKQELLDR